MFHESLPIAIIHERAPLCVLPGLKKRACSFISNTCGRESLSIPYHSQETNGRSDGRETEIKKKSINNVIALLGASQLIAAAAFGYSSLVGGLRYKPPAALVFYCGRSRSSYPQHCTVNLMHTGLLVCVWGGGDRTTEWTPGWSASY